MDVQQRLEISLPEPQRHLLGGAPDAFALRLVAASLHDGHDVSFTHEGVTVVVGGNNVGKSSMLADIANLLAHQINHPHEPTKVIRVLTLEKRGSQADVVAWLGEHGSLITEGQPSFRRPGTSVFAVWHLVDTWPSPEGEVGVLASFVTFYADARGRFNMTASQEMRDAFEDPATHPVHVLQDNRVLLDELSEAARQIFGTGLVLDTLGRTLRLRVGTLNIPAPPLDDIAPEYRAAMASLPLLDQQGDGMQSLMGLMLPLITATYPVIIIDEPEAFLHPPQAHALGRLLGRIARDKRVQVIVATHDKDFLAGLLEAEAPVSVVRLTRDAAGVHARQLEASEVLGLWTDPVLKYTNVLDGLFHRLVVLAEAEADCSYFAAALDHAEATGASAPPVNEVLFLPTGGKAGMAKVAAALTAVQVRVVATPDLDVLADRSVLKSLVSSLGGEWSDEMDRLYNLATVGMRSASQVVKVGHVLDSIHAVLDSQRDADYGPDLRDLVKAQLRSTDSPWANAKRYGVAAFDGQARQAVDRLLDLLETQGVVVVREGELECLAPEVATAKGSAWLGAALTAGAHTNGETQAHVARVLASGSLVSKSRPGS